MCSTNQDMEIPFPAVLFAILFTLPSLCSVTQVRESFLVSYYRLTSQVLVRTFISLFQAAISMTSCLIPYSTWERVETIVPRERKVDM